MEVKHLDFEIAGIFNRSVTIELCNDSSYTSPSSHTIYVDEGIWGQTDKNVISIDGLLPEHTYRISVEAEDEKVTHEITTKKETALLDVRLFGAIGDGETDDTNFIQAAINACPVDGTVYVPAGNYYVRPVFLKSSMTLWLDEGAQLLGSVHREDYPILPGIIRNELDFDQEVNFGTWEGNPLDMFASLITGIGVENVDIIGRGVLNGNGSEGDWWVDPKVRRIAWRPRTVFLNGCKNIRLQGITIQNSPSWTVHPYYSDDLCFFNLTIKNPYNSPNTDGLDPESCKNIKILGTFISVGDDGIALKSGKYYMSRAHHKPTSNVVIRNCMVERGHGCITIGSEISGGVRDVEVSRCLFSHTDRGIRLKTRRGRGDLSILENLRFSNIIMDNVHMPLVAGMFYFCDPDGHSDYVQNQEFRPKDERTPMIGELYVSDVTCTGADQSFICMYGLPEQKIEGLHLENVSVSFRDASQRHKESPLMMDGFEPISGKSFYLHNVKTVSIKNVTVEGSEDQEPELIDVDHVSIENLQYK